jgi:nitrile hydratase accessory protein
MNGNVAAKHASLPGSEGPWGAAEPTFREPWEAQAFAIVVALHRSGKFSWSEWTELLSAEIKADDAVHPKKELDAGENYYRCWLAAVEKLVVARNLASLPMLAERRAAWDRAARTTPHGQPIDLARGYPAEPHNQRP